jgi:hypothetical protein
MYGIEDSRLLEDACMTQLNWNIQRVANASRSEMTEALAIAKNIGSQENTVGVKSQTQTPKRVLKSSNTSHAHSRKMSPKPKMSVKVLTGMTVQTSLHDGDDDGVFSADITHNVEKQTRIISVLRSRLSKKKHLVESQHMTASDKQFLQGEIGKESRLLGTLCTKTKPLLDQLHKHIKSKRMLLEMYKGLLTDNVYNSEEWAGQDTVIIEDLKKILKKMEDVYTYTKNI